MLKKFNMKIDMRFVKPFFEKRGTGIDTYYGMDVPHNV